MNFPKTAYVLLWFPKPSETFVFSEVKSLFDLGLPLSVYSLYGRVNKNLSPEMMSYQGRVYRLGFARIFILPIFIIYWLLRSPVTTIKILLYTVFRKWKGIEKTAENAWACMCAFYLAYRFKTEGIQHIHAPWACGCATAAWLASRLTNIPFTFTLPTIQLFNGP